MLTLYYTPRTCALASHIALIDAGAPHDLHRIDFSKAEQTSPTYLAINPKGRVPALATPGGILTETPAILTYIAQSFPQAHLAPADAFAFAKMQEFNCFLASTLHVAHAHGPRGSRWTDDPAAILALKQKVPQTVTAGFAMVEAMLAATGGPFVMGADYSVADPYLYTLATWIEGDGVDTSALPRVLAHRAMMAARPSVIQAVAKEG